MTLDDSMRATNVHFGIKHVQSSPISYTRSSINLRNEYEDSAGKIMKDGETVAIGDPKCAKHLMSAVRYALTGLVGEGTSFDPVKRTGTA